MWLSSEDFKEFAACFPFSGKWLAGFSEEDFQKALGNIKGSALYNAVRELKGEKGIVEYYMISDRIDKPTSAELFGPNISGYKHKTALSIELPFQNREAEIETIARACLNSLKTSQLASGELSQQKITLLTSAQMWGCGKSWLGTHFLQQFRSQQYAPLRAKLVEEYGTEAVNTLTNCVYVPIDLRRDMVLPTGCLALLILRSLVGALITHFPEDRAFWESQPVSIWLPRTVLHWFSEKCKKTFFIHFDEVDAILEVPPKLERDEVVGIEAAKRFYDFWTFTHSIILTGNFLYATGRFVFHYDLLRSSYSTCLLLDTLKPQHLDNILAQNPGIEDADTRQYLALLLYNRTGGVPGFIGFAVDWLHKQGIGKDSKKEAIRADIFGDKFRDFVRDDKASKSELYPMGALGHARQIRHLYARLIALSALGAPLDINATINNPEAWGIRQNGRNNHFEVRLLDVLCFYNLWIEKNPSDGQWRIIFPDIVLDETAYSNRQPDEELLPYWIAFNKTRVAKSWNKETLLERIKANNMELAILDRLGIAKSATFEELFPFLSQSSIGKQVASLTPSSPYGRLPKIVNHDKGQGSAVSLDSLTMEEREKKLRMLKAYIAHEPSFREEIRFFKGDWNYLLKIVKPGILYIPVAKSASADLIYFASTMNSVHFRFKADKTILTMDNIIKEAQNAYADPLVADGKKLAFVIVALKVNCKTIKKKATPESKCIQGEQNLSIILQSGVTLGGAQGIWCVPDNMDIVIVLEKGLEQLITMHNLKLFEKKNVTIDEFVI